MKSAPFLLLAIAWAGFSTTGCERGTPAATGTNPGSSHPIDLAEARKSIEAKTDRFTRAHVTGDTAFLNDIFTAEARIFPPNAPMITGRRAIAAINAEYVGYGIQEFREEITALYGSGEYLINEGTYRMRYGPANTTETGNYLYVWKRVDGDWKIDANIWNTNTPATP